MESKREIIYVDAGKVDENFRISMYHVEKHRTLVYGFSRLKDYNEAEDFLALLLRLIFLLLISY